MMLIDLTHTLNEHVPAWDLGCGFQKTLNHDYDESSSEVKFRVQRFSCFAGIGTHMDAPSHCIPGGLSIADISIDNLFRPCVVIDVSHKAHEHYCISEEDVLAFEEKYGIIAEKSFVIFYTGWEKYWHEPARYRNNLHFPSVNAEAAQFLLKRNIVGIGIDTLSPDSGGQHFPVHQIILGAKKYIIENIANASKLPPIGAKIIALPLKIEDGTESPIRLIALIP